MGIKSRKTNVERIDTNILVRLIAGDNLQQVKKVKKLFARKDKLYVFEDSAMMEVVFVLSGPVYRRTRKQIAKGIKTAMLIPNLICNKSIIEDALDFYVEHPKLSFVDCYLAVTAETSGETPLWTFDSKLASQFPSAKLL